MAVVPTLQLWPYELKRAKLEPRIVELATADAVEQVRAFAKAGGQVLFGTDVGYMSEYDPTEEYRLMARALSPMEILASLTTAPAARWKEEARRGRIDAGLDADLVVLDGGSGRGCGELREGALHDPRRPPDSCPRRRDFMMRSATLACRLPVAVGGVSSRCRRRCR